MKIQALTQLVHDSALARRPHERQWVLNTAFIQGQHWGDYFEPEGRFMSQLGQKKFPKNYAVMNFVRLIAMTYVAKCTMNSPTVDIRPATDEDEDKRRAKMAKRLFQRDWEALDLQDKLARMVLHMISHGQGVWGVYWDADQGEDVELTDPRTGQPIRNVKVGSPTVDVISSFDIGLDPLADTIKQCRYAWRVQLVNKKWLKTKLSKTVSSKNANLISVGGLDIEHRNEIDEYLAAPSVVERGYVSVYELYDMDAQKSYWFTRDEILYSGKWEIDLPFIMARAIPNMGDVTNSRLGINSCWGQTLLSDVVPVQAQLNRLESQILEAKDNLIHPPMLIPRSAQIDRGQLDYGRSKHIYWSGNGRPPEPLIKGIFPSWANSMAQRYKDWMFEIAGVYDISLGDAPGSIQSARGINMLAEIDRSKLSPWLKQIDMFVRDYGIRVLRLYKQFATAPILLKAYGESGELEVEAFDTGEMNSFDVHVSAESTYAESKAMKRDQVLTLWSAGVLRDPRVTLRAMEIGNLGEVYGDSNADALKQKREIAKMLQGQPAQPDIFDDDYGHLEILDPFLKTVTFENQPEEIKQLFLAHREAHMGRIQSQMQAEQQAGRQRSVQAAGATNMLQGAGGQAPINVTAQMPQSEEG